MKGVILHGGSGTRLRPLTYTDVKQLLPVAGKPISEYSLENLIELGIKEISIVVGDVGEREVRDYYSDGSKWGVSIEYTYQDKPLGIAHAIALTEGFVGNDNFVVVLGDNYFQNGLNSLNVTFAHNECDALVALTEVNNPSQFGIAIVEDGNIVKLEEKPKYPKSNLAVAGAYFLRSSIFTVIKDLKPSWRNELEITEAFQLMLDRGMKIGYSLIEGWWKDTGTVDEFLECNRMILDKIDSNISSDKLNGRFQGRIRIGANVKIQGNTKILGPSFVGDNTVLEDSYIGPYSSVGSNCSFKNVEIEDSVIMDGCSLETSEIIRLSESIVGSNTKIAASHSRPKAIRLVVGRDCRIEL